MRGKPLRFLTVFCLVLLFSLTSLACASPGEKEKEAKVGETVTVKDTKYTVTAVNKVKEIGVAGNMYKAKGIFVVIDLTVENLAPETREFDPDMAKLWDERDQVYELNIDATSTACATSGIADIKNVWFASLGSGQTVKSKAVFDVPTDVKGLSLEVKSSEIGSEETAVIKLGI